MIRASRHEFGCPKFLLLLEMAPPGLSAENPVLRPQICGWLNRLKTSQRRATFVLSVIAKFLIRLASTLRTPGMRSAFLCRLPYWPSAGRWKAAGLSHCCLFCPAYASPTRLAYWLPESTPIVDPLAPMEIGIPDCDRKIPVTSHPFKTALATGIVLFTFGRS